MQTHQVLPQRSLNGSFHLQYVSRARSIERSHLIPWTQIYRFASLFVARLSLLLPHSWRCLVPFLTCFAEQGSPKWDYEEFEQGETVLGRLKWLEKGREGLLEELSEELEGLEGSTIQQV